MLSTSYNDPDVDSFITAFVKLIKPKVVVEIGCQQGKSAILLARGLEEDAILYTYDTFETNYNNYPYMSTHADISIANDNLKKAELRCIYHVCRLEGRLALQSHDSCDLLHIDICNHEENLRPLLKIALPKVKRAILLEGGVYNDWQKKYGFKPYVDMFRERWISDEWQFVVLPFGNLTHNSVTILKRIV